MKNLRLSFSRSRFSFLILVVVLVLSTLTSLSGATPPPLTITVVNNSEWEIHSLYLSPSDNDNWGVDQLNDSTIGPRTTRTLNVSWDQSTVKLVAEDKDGCFMSTTVQATGDPVWTIANNATRNCGN